MFIRLSAAILLANLNTLSSQLSSTTNEYNEYIVTIALRKGHPLRHGKNIGTSVIDVSTSRGNLCW